MVGLNMTPLGVVAFLWFMAVVRRRLGDHEDRFFATVFLGPMDFLFPLWLLVVSITLVFAHRSRAVPEVTG